MAFGEQPEGLTWVHYSRTIQATWRTQCYGACALLCEFALEHSEPTPELHCQLGMANFSLVQMHLGPFDQRAPARDVAAAFLAARKFGGDVVPEPAILFRGRALAIALDFAAAIADLDALLVHPEHGAKRSSSRKNSGRRSIAPTRKRSPARCSRPTACCPSPAAS